MNLTAKFESTVIIVDQTETGNYLCQNIDRYSGGSITKIVKESESALHWFNEYCEIENENCS